MGSNSSSSSSAVQHNEKNNRRSRSSTRKEYSSSSSSFSSKSMLSIKRDEDDFIASTPLIEVNEIEMTEGEGSGQFFPSSAVEVPRLVGKVLVLGSANVGKTSLIQSYLAKKIICEQQKSKGDEMTTVLLGVGEHGAREMHLQIWESRFPRPHHRNCDACILVGDLSNLASLISLRNHHLQFLNVIKPGNPDNFPFFIVGNKQDLSPTVGNTPILGTHTTVVLKEKMLNTFLSSSNNDEEEKKTLSPIMDIIVSYMIPNVRDDLIHLSDQLKGEIMVVETNTMGIEQGPESVVNLFSLLVETISQRLISSEQDCRF